MASLRVVAIAFLVKLVTAQTGSCYYPNGNWAADNQAPCSDSGGNCCSLQWQCLSNGLCFNPANNDTGRYGCTDRSWQSGGCTQICTNGNSAIGNEAILNCYGDVYCCNGDGSLNCCNRQSDPSIQFFSLPAGTVVRSILSVSSTSPSLQPTTNRPATFTDGSPISRTTTTSPTSTTTSSRSTTRTSVSSSLLTTTASDGRVYTTTAISIVTITAPASSGGGGGGTSGRTLGLAIGLPVGFVALGIIGLFIFFFRRRQHQKDDVRAHYGANGGFAENSDMGNSYGHFPPAGRTTEIDSFPIADTKNTRGELPGSTPGLGGVAPAPPTYSDAGTEKAHSFQGSTHDLNAVRGLNEGAPVELDGDSVPLTKPELHGDSSPLRHEEKPPGTEN